MLLHSFTSWLAFASVALALPRADPLNRALVPKQADGDCTNSPRTRQCWGNGFSIATDFEEKWPNTGATVTYNLEITNTTIPNPDGSGGDRPVMLVNGTYPGPTLRANWGDTIVVNVKSSLRHNGTGLHFHGFRQLNSCQHDGVPGVTECPIAPGKTRQYRFRATQYGTSWYHSHWSSQYGDGVLGAFIVDGPATANYDEDLGALPLTDWFYTPAFTLNEQAQHGGGAPPTPDNVLVNGTHINKNGGGKYAKINVVKGKKYRIRIINTSVDTTFSVTMDGHPFTVITADFVPIKPWVTSQLTITIGQRYDIIISADQAVDNYWFRVAPNTACGSNDIIGKVAQIGAILHYQNASDANPTSTTNQTLRIDCNDESYSNLIPFVPRQIPSSVLGNTGKIDMNIRLPNKTAPLRWLIDGTPHIVDWNNPTLETVLDGSEVFGPNSNVHAVPQVNGWYLWVIQSTSIVKLPHPIHLHGHDFYILDSKADATWDGSTAGLNLNNPTRRDTAVLQKGGYLLIAFLADNPGMWIMHCHIAWHAAQGLSMQFGERYDDIQKGALGDVSGFRQGCNEWDDYWYDGNPEKPYNQTDSGI